MGHAKRNRNRNSVKEQKAQHQSNPEVDMALNAIALVRTGGSVNVRGLGFQLFYSCFRLLQELSKDPFETIIRLEGVEDIDVIYIDNTEYVQLKSSINKIDAGAFWEMKVLQNFLPIYRANPDTNLRLVFNFGIAKGNLTQLFNGNQAQLDTDFWVQKFQNSGLEISKQEFGQFISKITFEKIDLTTIKKTCIDALTTQYQLNAGIQAQYLKALFYHVFQWAENRETVGLNQLNSVIQAVTDSFSKSPTNPAINNNWISEVSFQASKNVAENEYFDGKAARPEHIALDLPVPRKNWEKKIQEVVTEFSVTVIKSSSGQGKSTLAWRCALNLKGEGFFIYELNYCHEWNNVAAIVDFIKTRLSIGQVPIIVVDGLSASNAEWKRLAEELANMPVKLLVTTREEDWYRFGLDASKVSLQIVDIQLSKEEAFDVFTQLKKQGKLHDQNAPWQPAWERISKRGLLIEYIYLLTRGQLIEDRISEQIKQLNNERDCAAMLEILRLVALADVLNISLESQVLTNHIKDAVGFIGDRGEVYKQLEREYYIRFDKRFVQGLHAVRSQHLVDALHQTIQVEESLVSIFEIIEEKFIYDYFSSISKHVDDEEQKEVFLDQLAKRISSRRFSQMVYAIDGLMHGETINYWKENQQTYDEVAEIGAIDLFVSQTLPYTKLGTLESLKALYGDKPSNIDFLLEKRDQLPTFDHANSKLVLFVKYLGKHLAQRTEHIDRFEGIGFLARWFQQLDIPFPVAMQLSKENLLSILRDREIDEAAELFSYLGLHAPENHSEFIKENKDEILSTLKRGTQSVTIEEKDANIQIEYLLDNNADKADEYSVYRINTVYSMLPNYEHYCTKAIILPFPNEEIYKVVLENSTKRIPKENIGDTFDVHINQIWNRTIQLNYAASSAYEWQEQHIDLRKETLDFAKKCIRHFEARLEVNNSRIRSSSKPLIDQANRALVLFQHRTKYPNYSKKFTEDELFMAEQKLIRDWSFSMNNFCNQFVGIVDPKSSNDRNLAFQNLQRAHYELSGMQRGYETMVNEHSYFPTQQLIENEKSWYERLRKTVVCYINHVENSSRPVPVAKSFVESWWDKTRKQEFDQVLSIIRKYEAESYHEFKLPNRIIEEGILNKVVIGVEGLDLDISDDSQDLFYLLSGLSELTTTKVDSFIFVSLIDDQAISAFCVPRYFFERLQRVLDNEEADFEETEYGNPYALSIDQSLLESLEGIEAKEVPQTEFSLSFGKVMFGVWKLCEHRRRLDDSKPIELKWLKEVEIEYKQEITVHRSNALEGLEQEEFTRCKSLIDRVIKEGYIAENEEILELLNYRLERINETILYG